MRSTDELTDDQVERVELARNILRMILEQGNGPVPRDFADQLLKVSLDLWQTATNIEADAESGKPPHDMLLPLASTVRNFLEIVILLQQAERDLDDDYLNKLLHPDDRLH